MRNLELLESFFIFAENNLSMEQTIYQLDWQYDFWADIETIYPQNSSVVCWVTDVKQTYARLKTKEGIICFLYIKNVRGSWIVKDLRDGLYIDQKLECKVAGYSPKHESLTVCLNLD